MKTSIKTRDGKIMTVAPAGTTAKKDSYLTTAEVKKAIADHARKARSPKGRKTTADYIPFNDAFQRSRQIILGSHKIDNPKIGFLIMLGINTGFRISDLLEFRHKDITNLKPGDELTIIEQKTGKSRSIQINIDVCIAYADMINRFPSDNRPGPEDYIFTSQKRTVFSIMSVNRYLKQIFPDVKNISSHSLRKSFGRAFYNSYEDKGHGLAILMDALGHSSMEITKSYLGLRKEEVNKGYMNLVHAHL